MRKHSSQPDRTCPLPVFNTASEMTFAIPLTRLVSVIAPAVAVFGDEQEATHWLSTPLALFDNHTLEGVK